MTGKHRSSIDQLTRRALLGGALTMLGGYAIAAPA